MNKDELITEAQIRADIYTVEKDRDDMFPWSTDFNWFISHDLLDDVIHLTSISCEDARWCECWQSAPGADDYRLVGIHEIGKHDEEGW